MPASFIAHCKAKYLHRWERFQSNCHLHHKSMEYLLPLHNPRHISRCILVGRAVVFARNPLVLLYQKPVVVELDTCELRKGYNMCQKRYLLNCLFVCLFCSLSWLVGLLYGTMAKHSLSDSKFKYIPSQVVCVPDHCPSAWQVLVALPLRSYPTSHVKVQVSPYSYPFPVQVLVPWACSGSTEQEITATKYTIRGST